MSIITFKLSGDYAHYSQAGTIYSSLTYPIPPKTTIMGLVAGIIGERDYTILNKLKYSIKTENDLAKKVFCFNGILDVLSKSTYNKRKPEWILDSKEKKQFYRELIKKPDYTVFLNLEEIDSHIRDKIVDYIRNHKFVFMPYLGINFCIADFRWVDIESCKKITDDAFEVSTFTLEDDFLFDSQKDETRLTTAHMPCGVEHYRIFKNFNSFVIGISKNAKISTKNRGNIYEINGEGVYFV